MADVIVVTTADAAFFPLLRGLIRSLTERPLPGWSLAVGCLDVGLTPEQVEWVTARGVAVVRPGWDYDFPGQAGLPEVSKAFLARPFLRPYFPGHEVYLWLDSDTWVQDAAVLDLFVRGATRRGAAVVPEIDRASKYHLGKMPEYWKWAEGKYAAAFGPEVGRTLGSYPMLNAGVFALHRAAPHWDAWAARLAAGTRRGVVQAVDQTALNAAIYLDGLFPKTELLPGWCNWTCHMALPAWDAAAGRLVEPYLPHTPLGVVHLTGDKHHRVALAATDGGTEVVSLRYPGGADVETPLDTAVVDYLAATATAFAGRQAVVVGQGAPALAPRLAAAGVRLDVIDPALALPPVHARVRGVLGAAGVLATTTLVASPAPLSLDTLGRGHARRWALGVFVGDTPADVLHAEVEAFARHAAPDAVILVPTATAAAVVLPRLRDRGWRLAAVPVGGWAAVAWRGAARPVVPGLPGVLCDLPPHLAELPVVGHVPPNRV